VLGHPGGVVLFVASFLVILVSVWLSACISLYAGVAGKNLSTRVILTYGLNAVIFVILLSVFSVPLAFVSLVPEGPAIKPLATSVGGLVHRLGAFLDYEWGRVLWLPGLASFVVLGWVFYVLAVHEFQRSRLRDR
jgi:hypothetical protein